MTSAMVSCHQSGCDGTIQDEYCDTCGLAPVAVELVDMANAIRPRTLT